MEWGYVDIGLQSDESRPASSQIMMVQKERGCEVFSSPIVLLADRPSKASCNSSLTLLTSV